MGGILLEIIRFKKYFFLLIPIVFFGLAACAPHQIYRTDLSLCTHSKPETECKYHALQEFINPNKSEGAYTLGFIEFDDQGQLHQRAQMKSVIDHLTTQSATGNTLLSQLLIERSIDTYGPTGQISDIRSFGNFVVLINHAFKAERFSALSNAASER